MDFDSNPYELVPGTVIAVCYPMYKHFAIVSDRLDKTNHLPKLISLSYRTGKVEEEPWHVVVGDKSIKKSFIHGKLPKQAVLARARTCIDKDVRYELFTFNCEHFVRYAHGLPIESIQVKRAFYGAAAGAVSCLLLPKLTIARFAILTATSAAASLRSSLSKL